MFKKHRTRKDIDLLVEEKLYEHVAHEIAAGEIRQGLWAKATAQAISAAREDVERKYIELRVEYLRAEGRLLNQFIAEAEAASEPMIRREQKEQAAIRKKVKKQLAQLEREESGKLSPIQAAVIIAILLMLLYFTSSPPPQ